MTPQAPTSCFPYRSCFGSALALCVVLSACGGAQTPDSQANVPDFGAGSDQLVAPDLGGYDAGAVVGVGAPCDPFGQSECADEAICLPLSADVAVCAIPGCRPEDPSTAAREDTCPLGSACAVMLSAGPWGSLGVCLRACTPNRTLNSCASSHPDLACDPVSRLLTGYSEVCLAVACREAADCKGGRPTDPLEARCHAATGICQGAASGPESIGKPCAQSPDCGVGQVCYLGPGASDGPRAPGGYCTVLGCKYGGPWQCPAGSRCLQLGASAALSLCVQAGCDSNAPPEADGCRDEAAAGSYRCMRLENEGICWVTP